MAGNYSDSPVPLPLLALGTGAQAALAAGAEVSVGVPLPPPYLTPGFISGFNPIAIATVSVAALEPNVIYVAEVLSANPGGNSITVKVQIGRAHV